VSSSIRYSDLKKSDFFQFFNLTEVAINKTDLSKKFIKLKPGGFQEHIDIEFQLDGDYIIGAKILLDRVWMGNHESINPFGTDIAKSFIVAFTPPREKESIRSLVFFLMNLKGDKDILIPCQKPYQYFEKSEPEIVPFLDVYRNQRELSIFPLKDTIFLIKNILQENKPRFGIFWKIRSY
jgi:hypothetical protein